MNEYKGEDWYRTPDKYGKRDLVRYRHGFEIKHLILEGLRVDKRRRRIYLLEVDVTAAMSESGSNRRAVQSVGVIGEAGVVEVVVGKG